MEIEGGVNEVSDFERKYDTFGLMVSVVCELLRHVFIFSRVLKARRPFPRKPHIGLPYCRMNESTETGRERFNYSQ